ncbi:MAG: 23S rRNA (adenine(2503)-C(2))-methyltransferase RlmN [Oscillospiraceae bacterium]|nr:23S rRNA (adenine(2503)-C(2))-methyltransferase RlmN [Oscillospiraceae bacterium]
MIELRNLTLIELQELISSLGEPSYRAKQVFEWIHKGANSFDELTNIPKGLRERLASISYIENIKTAEKFVSNIDETTKYLLQLSDGNFIECVLMKYKHGYTVCISTQIGCRMGCKFCASSHTAFSRNLTAGEMLGQVLLASNEVAKATNGDVTRVSNVVLMGIGEPLDNFDNVLKFFELVNAPDGINIGQRHISLSTCGLADKIRELSKRNLQITLSVSLHAALDETRSEIMPINQRFDIDELMNACREYAETTGRRISFEYALIAGVNDGREDAMMLAELIKKYFSRNSVYIKPTDFTKKVDINLGLVHINLIPINYVNESGYERSKDAEKFRAELERRGVTATLRRELGTDIAAACGQLRAERVE